MSRDFRAVLAELAPAPAAPVDAAAIVAIGAGLLFGSREPLPWMVTPSLALLTANFLHGSWWHLIANMLFLRVFGDNVEDAMGHGRFLAFYLLCGAGSMLIHGLSQGDSLIPVVGASGAISGVMGAYLLLHPRSFIITLIGWLVIPLPAFLLLIVWMGFQIFSALGDGAGSNVAWWAHIGGFLVGMALTPLFKRGTAPYGGIHGIKKGLRFKQPGERKAPPRDEGDDGSAGPWGN